MKIKSYYLSNISSFLTFCCNNLYTALSYYTYSAKDFRYIVSICINLLQILK